MWFKLAERGGECPEVALAWSDRPEDLFWYHHADHDGLGCVLRAIEEKGHAVPPTPQRQETPPSSAGLYWAILRSLLTSSSKQSAQIAGFDPQFVRTSMQASRPVARAFVRLNNAQTQTMDAQAKRCDVSANTWLLSSLDRAMRAQLTDSRQTSHWLMPVNLRGPVQGPNDRANQAGSLGVRIAAHDQAQQVHQAIKRALERKEHWVAWWFLNLGRLVSEKTMATLAGAAGRFTGVFSNLGSWDLPEQEAPLIAFAQCFVAYPLAATAIRWNGEQVLMMTAHPALTKDTNVVQNWLDLWSRTALAQLA